MTNKRFKDKDVPEEIFSFIDVDEDGNLFINYSVWDIDNDEEINNKLNKYKNKKDKKIIKR